METNNPKRRSPFYHYFRGKRYRTRWAHLAKNKDADWNDDSREIRLGRHLFGDLLMRSALHEGLHACLPDLDEDAVVETEASLWDYLRKVEERA